MPSRRAGYNRSEPGAFSVGSVCGAGGGLRSNFPDVAKKIAKRRTKEAPKDAGKILTPCGLCTANLKTADDRTLEFSEWVLERMKLGWF